MREPLFVRFYYHVLQIDHEISTPSGPVKIEERSGSQIIRGWECRDVICQLANSFREFFVAARYTVSTK